MKKYLVLTVCAAMVLTGCGTYTGAGAYTGANLGSVLGSAIGGISGGHRGYHVGTIVGMAGGAILGGAIGSATDKKHSDDVHRHYEQVQQRKAQGNSGYDNRQYGTDYNSSDYRFVSTDSGSDETGSGDDRLYDFDSSDYNGDYTATEAHVTTPAASSANKMYSDYGYSPQIQIRNARFVDDNHDNSLASNEVSKVIFEVVNTSNETLYDIVPTVVESTGNKRIYISPSMHVERLAPGAAIRYTAMVKAGKLKDGTATFCVSVLQGNKAMSQVQEFTVQTKKTR
jgi:hypothetical protein